jgi:hypothetical protein
MRFRPGEADTIRDELRINLGVTVDDREREWRTGGYSGGRYGGGVGDRGWRERDDRGYSRVGGAGAVSMPGGGVLDGATVERMLVLMGYDSYSSS